MVVDARERILEATFACVARYGLGKTTVEDVAREAGISRATVYRTFPGGRDELLQGVIAWEAQRFFGRLAEAVVDATDFASMLERALLFAHRAIRDHAVLQKVLETEPERLLPTLTVEIDRILGLIEVFLAPYLERERLRPDVDPAVATDYVARLVVSYIGSPGQWDLTDPDEVRLLVEREFLAGIVEGAGAGVTDDTMRRR